MRVLALASLVLTLPFAACTKDTTEPPPGPGAAGSGGRGGSGPTGSAGSGGAAGATAGSGGAAGSAGSAGSAGFPGSGGARADARPADAGRPADASRGDARPRDAGTSDAGFPAAGLVKIFDGTSWDGWEYDPRCWTIVDGAMHGRSPSGQSQAFTRADYSNFRLILQTRMVKSDDHLGICLWGDRPAAGRYGFGGCLLVIPPSGAIWDYRDNSDNPRPGNNPIKYMFHQVEILANRTTGKVKVAVAGKLVHDYTDDLLSRRKAGPIGMQIHRAGDSEVEYKDISIEVDPKEDRLITLTP